MVTMVTLEEIVERYGALIDYIDPITGYVYRLSDAFDDVDNEGQLLVPVTDCMQKFVGYAKMRKPENMEE